MTKVKIDLTVKKSAKEMLNSKEDILESKLHTPKFNAEKLSLNDDIYSIDVVPVVNQMEAKRNGKVVAKSGVTDLKLFNVKPICVKMLAETESNGDIYTRINGSIDIPVAYDNRKVSIEDCYFSDELIANSYAIAANEIEAEKAQQMKEEVEQSLKLYDKVNKILEDEIEYSTSADQKKYNDDDEEERIYDGDAVKYDEEYNDAEDTKDMTEPSGRVRVEATIKRKRR